MPDKKTPERNKARRKGTDPKDIQAMAERVDEAARQGQAIDQFAAGTLNVSDAYAVQAASVERRLRRGEAPIGIKLGFTSRAKMVQMGVEDLIWGRLTDAMLVEEGGQIDLDAYVHPRVEPELAFLIDKPLTGLVTLPQVQAAIGAVAPAMEIIDSRYRDFKFDLPSVVADNASSSGLVLGAWRRADLDIANLGMVMSLDGEVRQVGSSAAILGHPLRALVAAARLVGEAGLSLRPGDVVLAGAATAAEPLRRGQHVELRVQHLGGAEFQVAG